MIKLDKFKHDNMFEGFGRVYNKQTDKQTQVFALSSPHKPITTPHPLQTPFLLTYQMASAGSEESESVSEAGEPETWDAQPPSQDLSIHLPKNEKKQPLFKVSISIKH